MSLWVSYEMTVVVGVAAIVTQEAHRVPFCNVLWMLLHERLDAVPKRWNGLHVLVQAQNKAVLLVVVFHEFEGVIMYVAEQLDAWFHAPVVVKLVHQRVSEEEAGLEPTHMPVADGVSIDDLTLCHVFPDFSCLVLIDEVRERPVLLGDLPIVCFS